MTDQMFLGQDLDLGFIADEEGRVFAGPSSQVDFQPRTRAGVSPRLMDLGLIGGRANLVQSVILRLKTERGELESLGHPKYGSHHHQLIGEPNVENTRNLIKLFVLECLRQEPRLKEPLEVTLKPSEGTGNRDKVLIEIKANVENEADPLSLVLPFSFAGPLE